VRERGREEEKRETRMCEWVRDSEREGERKGERETHKETVKGREI